MSEVDQEMLAQLDTNISDVDTSYPVIHAKVYEMEVKSADIVDSKSTQGSKNLKIAVKTTEELSSVTNERVPKGFTLTSYTSITPSEDRPLANIQKDLARIGKAAGVGGSIADLLRNPAVLVGKRVKVDIGVQKATQEFPERNNVKSFVVTK